MSQAFPDDRFRTEIPEDVPPEPILDPPLADADSNRSLEQTTVPGPRQYGDAVPASLTVLGGYRLRATLGRGGMGLVYEAEPLVGGQPVALKTLQTQSAAALAKLKAEFRVVADLAHPNLVQLGELNTTVDVPFFTMEIVRGVSFDQFVRSGLDSAAAGPLLPYDDRRLRDSLRQLADGLLALHQAGLVHRDLKPSNVLVSHDGRVVILDMGLAVSTEPTDSSRDRTEIAGTPYFMSPEQARGQTITAASDWYSVGVMLFEALTGERLFQTRRSNELLREKLSSDPPDARAINPAIPEDLHSLCRDLLSVDPRRRPDAAQVLERLQAQAVSITDAPIWIGREPQLDTLHECWTDVRSGICRIVLVSGPSGMGKTSLVDHFLSTIRRRDSVIVLRGRCYENESVAYRGFDGVVDSLADYLRRCTRGEVERVLPLELDSLCQLFPVLGEVPQVSQSLVTLGARRGDPRARRQRGIEALGELLRRLSRYVPLVIFIDDLHLGDDDTVAIFRQLFLQDAAPELLFLATYRSEDAEENPCLNRIRAARVSPAERPLMTRQVELDVDRLSHAEATRLAASLLMKGDQRNSIVAERIAIESEGDPLFIRMLVDFWSKQQDLRPRADESAPYDATLGRAATRHPSDALRVSGKLTLAGVIDARLAALEGQARVALETLAAAGRPLNERWIEQIVAPERESVGLIRSLRIQRLIRRMGHREELEIFHDKIRESLLRQIPTGRIQRYCVSIATAMEQTDAPNPPDVDFIADLFRRGGENTKAGEYYILAAEKADRSFAFQRAIECYRYALEFLKPSGPRLQQLRRGLGDALANASRSAEAAQQYLLAAESAATPDAVDLRQMAALRYLTSGHVEEGIHWLRVVLAANQLPWPASRWSAVLGLASRMARLNLRGLSLRQRAPISAQDQRRLDACWAAAAGLSLVDPLRGTYYITDSVCRSLSLGSADTLCRDLAAYMGVAAIGGSRSRPATRRVLKASRSLARERQDAYSKAMQSLSQGIAALLRGRWSSCLRGCDRALQYLNDPSCHGKTWEVNTARTFALWALQYQGNFVELSRRQPELLREAKASDDLYATLNFGTQVMAHLQLAADAPDEALHRLDEDRLRLSDRGFFVQHHNYILATTFSLIYSQKSREAVETIDGVWAKYRREFLSQIQQIRIDHRQVLARAWLAFAQTQSNRAASVARAHQLVRALKRENVQWASSLAIGFEASILSLTDQRGRLTEQLRLAERAFEASGMMLFAASAKHHQGNMSCEAWQALGIANGDRFAATLLPGFE